MNQRKLFQYGYHVNPDVRLLGYTQESTDIFISCNNTNNNDVNNDEQQLQIFNLAENAGSEVFFRCVKCRGCKTCKSHSASDETMSVREEVEQDLID